MEAFLKRKCENSGGTSKKPKLEECPHGLKCYRRNPHHFKEYHHPDLIKMLDGSIPENLPQDKFIYEEQLVMLRQLQEPQAGPSKTLPLITTLEKAPQGTMLAKLEKAAPYNVFFTVVPKAEATLSQSNSITFTDLLCPSLGILKESLQINFMIDIDWLMRQYKERGVARKPLTILYGDDWPDMKEFIEKFLPNVTHHYVKMKDQFGCHHSKIGIYHYEDNSLRIVISTANLYYEDWNNYNQGLWVSPACPILPSGTPHTSGESPTCFKAHLLKYLQHYSLPCLNKWIELVKLTDFSAIRVFLITSVPGKHYPRSVGSHVHHVADLLNKHCSLPIKTNSQSEGPLSWGVIAQASSIGSMGKDASDWLRGTILRTLATHKHAPPVSNSSATISIVYPSVENVLGGYFGKDSGGCLPYSKATNEKQRWLQTYLHQWKADQVGRTRAMPHIKTYCRISPCLGKLAWFLMTSANLSKSAWGSSLQKDLGSYVRSYEAGILFLPQFFEEEFFNIGDQEKKRFPFMYDLPLTEYKSKDYPWCN